MEPTNILYQEAAMAYRKTYLTEQVQRPGARARRTGAGTHRRRLHLRWPLHPNAV